jgi:hypothetical protein
MSWRGLLFSGCMMAALGCSTAERLLGRSGRLRLERAGRSSGGLLDVPAEAAFCAADSTLRITGADRSWSAAIALRTTWPATSLEFAIDSLIGGPGSAAVAARPIRDSVGMALVAVRGLLRLAGRTRVAGTVDLLARGATDTVRLKGSFEAPSAVPGGCPRP